MSTTRHDVDYKKLPISKLKSLLSAGGVTIPHVKDQPKEYYIKLYETHILKESTSEDEGSEDQSESESYSAEDLDEATQIQMQPQYIAPPRTTEPTVSTTSPSTARVDVNVSTRSRPSHSSRVFFYLIPLLLAVLVSLSMTCTAQGPHAHHTACHVVQRLVHVLSLGLYGHNSGAADY